MASPTASSSRQKRLAAIAEEWGVKPLPPVSRLVRPLQATTLRTANDEAAADELLKRQRSQAAGSPDARQRPTLKRAFTTSSHLRTLEPNEIFAALNAHVAQDGAPGVAEALVAKLIAAGGDVNVASTRTKTSLLTRRRSVENLERSRLLQRAIGHQNAELVAVLVPYADALTLDASLPHAIRTGNVDIVTHLLRYGASVNHTAGGQDAFRQLCTAGGQPDLLSRLLACDNPPLPAETAPAMVHAAKRGCLDSVLRLSRATADGNYNGAAALKQAITASRVDIALAILIGTKPPTGPPLNEAFQLLFSHQTILPNEKMALAEVLLCAGAGGDPVAAALAQACLNNFSEMVSLLVYYGASVEYDDASAIRSAVSQNKLSLVRLLLADGVTLSPQHASACLASLPKQIANEERRIYLELFLRKGASGTALHDCLIDVAEAGDIESAKLLLTPHFPTATAGATETGGTDRRRSGASAKSGRASSHRHHTASAEYKEGMALHLAVQTANFDMVNLILATRPAPDIVAEAFPNIFNLPRDQRLDMFGCFLSTGFAGPCVHAALQQAIQEQPPERDQRLIALLLRSKADVNYGGGAGILSAVAVADVPLLQTLLQNSAASAPTLAAALPQAMAAADPLARRHMVYALVSAGAHQERVAVAEALVAALSASPVDLELLKMLLKKGAADVNYKMGTPVILAAACPDAAVLDAVLRTKQASPETLGRGLFALSDLPSTTTKEAKLLSLLRYTAQQDALDHVLATEVQSVVKSSPKQRILTTIQILLSAGADVNAHNASALSYAVAAPNLPVVELLLKAKPTPASLVAAIPRVFYISDAMDRFALTKMLLDAGVPPLEASRALNHAVVNSPNDLPLLKILAAAADPEDASGLLAAVKHQRSETVNTILSSQQFAVPVLNSALAETMHIADRSARKGICRLLLAAGASGPAVSDALLTAAAESDHSLGSFLLANGASIDHHDGQAIVLACRSGALDVLKTLLLKSPLTAKDATLERGFQEAEKLDDLATRANVFALLLGKGVRGEALDKQLLVAASYGDDGLDLVRLLLAYGASPDYQGGEAVWTSTRNGSMPTLKLLLGLDNAAAGKTSSSRQTPSQETMVRALKASWMLQPDLRYQVIQWLFEAGLQATEAVHIALDKAVKDRQPNVDLVRLLLMHGASPLVNGCQTLVDAAWRCLAPVMELCLTTASIPAADIDYAFAQAFTEKNALNWVSPDGLAVAKMLLDKGASGQGLAKALEVAIFNCDDAGGGGSSRVAIAQQLVEMLIQHKADVDTGHGQPLQAAAKAGNVAILKQLLSLQPSPRSIAMAFPYVFEADVSDDVAFAMITLFSDYQGAEADGGGGGGGVDVMFKHPELDQPVVFRALAKHPRSLKILTALLDMGYYHDRMVIAHAVPEVEEYEAVSLLFWALLQPQKKISSALVELLVARGAMVNFETQVSKMTPLMLAIQTKRPDLVQVLIDAGAEVDVADHTGNTPLLMAVRAGGDVGVAMMTSVLEAGPSRNDGSLHVAARDLNLKAMKVLVQHGHAIDFPSPLHEGRSALAEVCLHGSDGGGAGTALTAGRLKDLDRAIAFLMDEGSDITLRSDGKTPLLLAFSAEDPVATTQALLKAGMYTHMNSAFNRYNEDNEGRYTYSPTMYVARVLPLASADVRDKLLNLLRISRAQDVFYANVGPQPAGAVGMPDDLLRTERERHAQLSRAAAEEEERVRARRHTQELAQLAARVRQDELAALKARAAVEADAARKKTLAEAQAAAEATRIRSEAEAEAMRRKALVEAEAMQALVLRHEAEHAADLEQTKRTGEAQLQIEDRRQKQLLVHERQLNAERTTAAERLSRIVLSERRSLDKIHDAQNKRERARLSEGRMLADAISQMPNGQGNRNVAGYIMGEVN